MVWWTYAIHDYMVGKSCMHEVPEPHFSGEMVVQYFFYFQPPSLSYPLCLLLYKWRLYLIPTYRYGYPYSMYSVCTIDTIEVPTDRHRTYIQS
jgi:hypothetical protein